MKKIIILEKQLKEVLDVAVNVENGNVNDAIADAKEKVDNAIGVNTERNYVITNEDTTVTDDLPSERLLEIEGVVKNCFLNIMNDDDLREEFENEEGKLRVLPVLEYISDNIINIELNEKDWDFMKSKFSELLKMSDETIIEMSKKEIETLKLHKLMENTIVCTKADLFKFI